MVERENMKNEKSALYQTRVPDASGDGAAIQQDEGASMN